MTLNQEALQAQKVRTVLVEFKQPCPEDARSIERAISELSMIGLVLVDINELLELDHTGAGLDKVEVMLRDAHDRIAFVLADCWACIKNLPRDTTSVDYQIAWKDMNDCAYEREGKPLDASLSGLQTWFTKLKSVLQKYTGMEPISPSQDEASFSPTTQKAFEGIQGVGTRLQGRPGTAPKRASFADAQTPRSANSTPKPFTTPYTTFPARPRTPDRTRSAKLGVPERLPSSIKQSRSYERERPMSPAESSTSSNTSERFHTRGRSYAPTPPLSPAHTTSSLASIASSTPTPVDIRPPKLHWARNIGEAFRRLSHTSFANLDGETLYHVENGTKDKHTEPDESYSHVLQLAFPDQYRVSLVCRQGSQRAKIMIRYRNAFKRDDYTCIPLSELYLRREGATLVLQRRRTSGRLVPWFSMQMSNFEQMVLFTNTFVAMRNQDATVCPPCPAHDVELRDDISEFQATILHDGQQQALRLWRDKLTGSIRLQGSLLAGSSDRVPVWTVFISDELKQRENRWFRLVDKKTLVLIPVTVHVFSDRFKAPTTSPPGGFFLKFDQKGDAEALLEVLEGFRRRLLVVK